MYTAKDIRNLALLGHGGDGKSALCESMLYVTKAITRLGKRADGTTVSDFDDEEKKRQYSIKTSVIPVEFGGCKLNVLDNPGYFDFAAEIVQSLRVADLSLICLTAKSGIAVGTGRAGNPWPTPVCPQCSMFRSSTRSMRTSSIRSTPCAISSAPPSSLHVPDPARRRGRRRCRSRLQEGLRRLRQGDRPARRGGREDPKSTWPS